MDEIRTFGQDQADRRFATYLKDAPIRSVETAPQGTGQRRAGTDKITLSETEITYIRTCFDKGFLAQFGWEAPR